MGSSSGGGGRLLDMSKERWQGKELEITAKGKPVRLPISTTARHIIDAQHKFYILSVDEQISVRLKFNSRGTVRASNGGDCDGFVSESKPSETFGFTSILTFIPSISVTVNLVDKDKTNQL